MLPSLRGDADLSYRSFAEPEFDKAMEALRTSRKLRDPRLVAVAKKLAGGRVTEAKSVLIGLLAQSPHNPDALNLMAEIAGREGQHREAETLLARCVQTSPGIDYYRYNHALALERLGGLDSALAETDVLIKSEPHNLIIR